MPSGARGAEFETYGEAERARTGFEWPRSRNRRWLRCFRGRQGRVNARSACGWPTRSYGDLVLDDSIQVIQVHIDFSAAKIIELRIPLHGKLRVGTVFC